MLEEWDELEADFQQVYGLDLTECRGKSWRWFLVRAKGLLRVESRMQNRFNPPKKPKE